MSLIAQTTTQSPIGLSYLWVVPAIVLIVGAGIGCAVVWLAGDRIDQGLANHPIGRRWLVLGAAIILPLLLGIVIDLADVTKAVRQLNMDFVDCLWASGSALMFCTYCTVQWLLNRHTERTDARLEESRILLDQARGFRDFQLRVHRLFLRVVGLRGSDLQRVLSTERNGCLVPHIREGVAPATQIGRFVNAAFELFSQDLSSADGQAKLRIALFRNLGKERLELVHSWDGSSPRCVTSPSESPARFAFTEAATDCLAVWACQRGTMEVIEDAEKADKEKASAFHYFTLQQREYIRSLLAIPIPVNKPFADFVLMLDTDLRGFFNMANLERYKLVAENLAQNLLHEADIDRLLVDCVPPQEGAANV